MAYLAGWQYRKSHQINPASGAGTGYQIRIKAYYGSGTDSGENVYLSGKCRTDFGDVRFTDDDGTTLLNYWMEEKVDGNYAIFWVKVNDDLSTNAQTIYIYYGNPNATTTSNKANTVETYEDFENGTLGKFVNILDQDYFSVTSSVVKEGSYAAQANDTSSAYGGGRYSNPGVLWTADNVKIVWWMRCDATSTAGGGTEVYFMRGGKVRAVLSIRDNGVFRYWNGSSIFFGTSSKATWYKFIIKLHYSELKYDFEIRDVNDNLLYSYENINMGAVSVSYTDVMMYSSGDLVGLSYWDNFYVLKYVKPEPSHGTWGTEETTSIFETQRLVSISSTISGKDRAIMNEKERLVNITSTIMSLIKMKELQRLISIVSNVFVAKDKRERPQNLIRGFKEEKMNFNIKNIP